MVERPSLHALELFLATVEHGTLSAAAAAKSLSQPAISMHLRALERLYRTPLMERQGRRLQPTVAGLAVADYTRRILALVDELERAVADVSELRAGELRLGASATIGETLLPEVLGRFRRAYPSIELVVQIGNSATIIGAVSDRTLGLAIVGAAPPDPELESAPLFNDALELFVNIGSPWLDRAPVPLDDLADETVILREPGSATRDLALACLAARGVALLRTLQFGSNEAVKRAVAAGLGIGILSVHTLAVDQRAGDIAILPCIGWDCRRQFWLIRRRDRELTRAERAFLQLAGESASADAGALSSFPVG
jgi:DNA-binding transcriptional LysR family regulator